MTVTGGTTPYSYSWSNESTTEDISGLRAQFYRVLVTDANAVTAEASITLTEPLEFSISLTASEFILDGRRYNVSCPTCFDGTITTTVTNGITPISFLWENSSTNQNRSGLPESQFKNVATDLNGCLSVKEIYLDAPERTDWQISGNSGSNPTTNFIGTNDNADLVFKTNSTEQLRITSNGNIKLNSFNGVSGSIYADEYGELKIGIPSPPPNVDPCNIPGQVYGAPMWYSKVVPSVIYACPGVSLGLGTSSPLERFHVQGNAIFTKYNGGGIVSSPLIKGGNTFAQSSETEPDYTWFSNTNTGIFHPELNAIAFSSAGEENMRIKENRVGIGTSTPVTTLHVNSSLNGTGGSVAFVGPNSPTFLTLPAILGPGTRMTWDPDLGSFRAGHEDNAEWDFHGNYSFAIGVNNTANGNNSFAGGIGSFAGSTGTAGENAFAFGNTVTAMSANSFAVGNLTVANGGSAFACGDRNTAGGPSSFAAGVLNLASGMTSTSFGTSNIAFGASSAVFGSGNYANGDQSFAIGSGTISNGSNSLAAGFATTAASNSEFCIGRYNQITNGDPLFWDDDDAVFQIGIGNPSPKNAMTVFKNGNVCINTITPSTGIFTVYDDLSMTTVTFFNGSWAYSSDSRLKENIQPLESSLEKITKLEGVSYKWKNDPQSPKVIGFIAQDVEKVFPESVVKDKNGNYLMATQNLVAPIVEAIKEQQIEIDAKNTLLDQLHNTISQLESDFSRLEKQLKSVDYLTSEIEKLKSESLSLNNKINQCCAIEMSISENSSNNNIESYHRGNELKAESKILSIFPNPFDNFTLIKYQIQSSVNTAVLTFQDVEGKIIDSKVVSEKSEGQYLFDGNKIGSGIYLCTLWINGVKNDTRLLIINK